MSSKLVSDEWKPARRAAATTTDRNRNAKAMKGVLEFRAGVVPPGMESLTLEEAQHDAGRQSAAEGAGEEATAGASGDGGTSAASGSPVMAEVVRFPGSGSGSVPPVAGSGGSGPSAG